MGCGESIKDFIALGFMGSVLGWFGFFVLKRPHKPSLQNRWCLWLKPMGKKMSLRYLWLYLNNRRVNVCKNRRPFGFSVISIGFYLYIFGLRGYIGFRGCHSKNRYRYRSKNRGPYYRPSVFWSLIDYTPPTCLHVNILCDALNGKNIFLQPALHFIVGAKQQKI